VQENGRLLTVIVFSWIVKGLDWKLARVTSSNTVEIRDVMVASIFLQITLHSKVTKLWILKIFWDEDNSAELLEDDNSSLLNSEANLPFLSMLSSAYF